MRTYNFQINFDGATYRGVTKGLEMEITQIIHGEDDDEIRTLSIPLIHWKAIKESIDRMTNDIQKPQSENWGSSG